MSLPVYMYEDNYEGRPFNRKMAPQTYTRRISLDSLMDRPRMHSRSPSVDSSMSSMSSGRNRLHRVCLAHRVNKPQPALTDDQRSQSTTRHLRHGPSQAHQSTSHFHLFRSGRLGTIHVQRSNMSSALPGRTRLALNLLEEKGSCMSKALIRGSRK